MNCLRKLRPTLAFPFVAALLLGPRASQAQSAAAFIVIDQHSGHILAAEEPNRKRPIASITKVATAMVVLDWSEVHQQDLNEIAVVPQSALTVGGANPIGLQPGDRLSLRDCIYAALLQSDNVAAHTLANHVGQRLKQLARGDEAIHKLTNVDYFVRQMNALGKKLAMTRTAFFNPTGLDSVDRPHSTAGDVARLTRYAMSDAGFRFYVSQSERKIAIARGEAKADYLVRNTNTLLGTDSVDGVKTGMTDQSGPCVVISAARAPEVKDVPGGVQHTPRRLVVVVLGAPDRFGVARSLLAEGWRAYDAWTAKGRPVDKKSTL